MSKLKKLDSFSDIINHLEGWIEYHQTPTKDQDSRWDQAKCEAWQEVIDLIKKGSYSS